MSCASSLRFLPISASGKSVPRTRQASQVHRNNGSVSVCDRQEADFKQYAHLAVHVCMCKCVCVCVWLYMFNHTSQAKDRLSGVPMYIRILCNLAAAVEALGGRECPSKLSVVLSVTESQLEEQLHVMRLFHWGG